MWICLTAHPINRPAKFQKLFDVVIFAVVLHSMCVGVFGLSPNVFVQCGKVSSIFSS